jgi:hypothetical protein
MQKNECILKTIRVLCLLVLFGALGGCNLGPEGPCYIWMATGSGKAISIQYGVRCSGNHNAYPEYCVHKSAFYQGSNWWKDDIAYTDATATSGDEVYVSAAGDQGTTISTRIVYLDNSNIETCLVENDGTTSCESAYVFKGSGSYAGGGLFKVICAELHRQGLMDETIFEADEAFGKYLRDNHRDVLLGYQLWAKPVVKWMQKSETFTRIVASVATPWSYEMAYRMGARDKGSVEGKILMFVGVPVCRAIGRAMIWAGNMSPREDTDGHEDPCSGELVIPTR